MLNQSFSVNNLIKLLKKPIQKGLELEGMSKNIKNIYLIKLITL